MMVQAPDASLLRQMWMRRIRSQQLVQGPRSRIEIAIMQVREHGPDAPRERNKSRDVSCSELRDGCRVEGEDPRQGGERFACRGRYVAVVVRVQLVDEIRRYQQAGIDVTV
jgi:hypothetical protein